MLKTFVILESLSTMFTSGFGLDYYLKAVKRKLVGVLNGNRREGTGDFFSPFTLTR